MNFSDLPQWLMLVPFIVLAVIAVLRYLRERNAPEGSPDESWAIAEWRKHGERVFEMHRDTASISTRITWAHLAEAAERDAKRRVCAWCGTDGHGSHKEGITNVKGSTRSWYCSNRCYQQGHTFEATT